MEHTNIPKVDGRSVDLIAQHIAQLEQIFPEAIKEGRVDFEVLNDLLGNYTDVGTERFCFHWAGKADARREAQKRSTGTLRPCHQESLDWEGTNNLYIEGDNLEVLKLLQKSYHSRVKMIYIDPPYNTGKNFVYKDNYADNMKNYLERTQQDRKLSTNTESHGRYHSNWLNMMYPRLKLARNLLKEDGAIFISIDDNEVANLRKICDEIFGEDNFIGQWNWFKSATPPNLSKKIKKNIEYILCYQKGNNTDSFKGIIKSSKSDDPLTKPQNSIKILTFPPHSIHTKLSDGVYKAGIYGTNKFPNELLEDLIVKDGRNENSAVFSNKFIWLQSKLKEELSNGTRITLSKQLVLSYKKAQYGEEVPPNLIDKTVHVDTTESAGRELTKLFDNRKVFDYPKPVSLLVYLCNMLVKNDDIILDFFSGSGTTAHAVMQLNANDGGNRRYICVQLPEATPLDSEARKAGYETIPEIAKERIRRAGRKVVEETIKNKPLDTGFRVFKLDSSNINAWDSNPDNLEVTLHNALFHLKEDRTEEDLLFEILLKYGMELTQRINRHTIDGKTVYETGAGSLIVCLSDFLSTALAEGIGKLYQKIRPNGVNTNCRVVLKDNGFNGSDEVKTKTLLILKQQGITNVATV